MMKLMKQTHVCANWCSSRRISTRPFNLDIFGHGPGTTPFSRAIVEKPYLLFWQHLAPAPGAPVIGSSADLHSDMWLAVALPGPAIAGFSYIAPCKNFDILRLCDTLNLRNFWVLLSMFIFHLCTAFRVANGGPKRRWPRLTTLAWRSTYLRCPSCSKTTREPGSTVRGALLESDSDTPKLSTWGLNVELCDIIWPVIQGPNSIKFKFLPSGAQIGFYCWWQASNTILTFCLVGAIVLSTVSYPGYAGLTEVWNFGDPRWAGMDWNGIQMEFNRLQWHFGTEDLKYRCELLCVVVIHQSSQPPKQLWSVLSPKFLTDRCYLSWPSSTMNQLPNIHRLAITQRRSATIQDHTRPNIHRNPSTSNSSSVHFWSARTTLRVPAALRVPGWAETPILRAELQNAWRISISLYIDDISNLFKIYR